MSNLFIYFTPSRVQCRMLLFQKRLTLLTIVFKTSLQSKTDALWSYHERIDDESKESLGAMPSRTTQMYNAKSAEYRKTQLITYFLHAQKAISMAKVDM